MNRNVSVTASRTHAIITWSINMNVGVQQEENNAK